MTKTVSLSVAPTKTQLTKSLYAQYRMKGFNQTKSALYAGTSEENARTIGSKFEYDPYVIEQMEVIAKELEKAGVISVASHMIELSKLRDKASELEQMGAAITAEVARGKAGRLYVEQIADVTAYREPQDILEGLLKRIPNEKRAALEKGLVIEHED